ncbi:MULTISPECIES: sporulation protein [Lysinibacillus]|uniref:Sporulation protein SpoOM n=1 Tax=Lysinibacillus antri TaxID=2498145 RepID=A0A432LGK5_9BACI|nr:MULTISPECIES: sporulation protein [Lysinibacillus]RUL57096.1 sporulation protein SpoOM [Lysinibacillus antri]TSI03270.1 sporulation protein SpoOM [Lysinibacillus sp. BW-2-10]
MSFFNKMLASIGIGAAKVDTKLEKSSYTAGEQIRGEVEIYGGNVEQQIDAIYLTLYTTYIKEIDDNKITAKAPIEKYKVSEPFTIGVNETKIIPFSFTIPVEVPITVGRTQVWVATELDIRSGVDSQDKDYIEIRPSKIAAKIFDEISALGFRLRQAECEQASYKYRRNYPFIQEFEFVPVGGAFRGRLDELEIMFMSQSESSAEIIMQIDRKARGFGGFLAEALDADETHVRMTITQQDLHNLGETLRQTIARYS